MTRLHAICSLIEPCPLLADIGCDHGKVSRYALRAGVGRVIAADIAPGSLDKARRLLKPFSPRVRFVLSDGFDAIDERVDEAVIAGLGGRLITEIVSRIDYRPRLVLAPQHDTPLLRAFLAGNGYRITADMCTYDRGKFYEFIAAEEGAGALSEAGIEYGAFCEKKSEALRRRLTERREKLLSYSPTPENKRLIAITEEVLDWQK